MEDEFSRYDNLESILQYESPEPHSMPLEFLRRITKNFSYEQLLGEGGFGKVYKGVLQNGKIIAVKKLDQLKPGVQERQFENEHNGKYVFAEMQQRLVCLEYLPNGSLDGHLSDEYSGLDWCTRYKIIRGTCSGLHYLHEECERQFNASIVHLDLKPANILLDNNMVPKIADFGLSRLFDVGKSRTRATSPAGSLGYMAPEYIYQHTITKKADIYSLGVIIVEIVTGCRFGPSGTETFCENFVEPVLKNWRNRLQATPRCTSPETDCQQIEFCLKIGLSCIKFNPSERPTIMEVVELLSEWESRNYYDSDEETSPINELIHEPKELLEITQLEFHFSLERNMWFPCRVKLTNMYDGNVMFQFIVMNAENTYLIEPAIGCLMSQSSCYVVITMEWQGESPWGLECNDKILMQSILDKNGVFTSKLPITADMFNSMPSKMVNNRLLPVVYVPPAQPTNKSLAQSNIGDTQISKVSRNMGKIGDSFSYEELANATSGFGKEWLISHGHSGDLYRGMLQDGTSVVVKVVGARVAWKAAHTAELEFCVKGLHERIVPFMGHCLDKEEQKFLVYRFVRNGDLSSALKRKLSLDWITRLKVATGIAEALCYMHHECTPPMVHRDVQASSILLDDKFEVRLGSLSEVCPQEERGHQNVIKRLFKFSSKENRSSGSSLATCSYDAYCFGKVLMELVTGRIGSSASNDAATSEWLDDTLRYVNINEKELMCKIIDPTLVIDEDHLEEIWAMAIVAKSCLNPSPSKRPPMKYVLKGLENPLKVVREIDSPSTRAENIRIRSIYRAGLPPSLSCPATSSPPESPHSLEVGDGETESLQDCT
ncbi:hypothetical protein QOZ80_6BG0496450 [Eleusine coracana subsp. coracana]|nr:hypothetical protein QOZ80_6BG0496450 [Eleusine coracana subsp. coracana]